MFQRIAHFARILRDRERVGAFLAFTWHRFLEDSCLQTAGALAFTSLFAMVPLTAAVLGILAAVPGFASWRGQLTQWVFDNFVPTTGSSVLQYITQFADNASKATAVGALVLLFSATSLMMSIEDAFNRIWRVQITRGVGARFVIYWTALTLGPLLVVAALAISSYAFALPFIDAADAQFSLKTRVLNGLPFLIVLATLFSAYTVIPNRDVRLRHALIGALLASILFEATKRAFAFYVVRYASYEQVYGALAMAPIFFLWIYLSWMIVLFGASITASLSAFDYRTADMRLSREQEFSGLLGVLAQFAAAQRAGKGVCSEALLEAEPLLDDDLLQRYLGDLYRVGLIQRGDQDEWLVVRDLASIDLLEIYEEGGYRLPVGASLPLDARAQPAAVLLDRLGIQVREVLGIALADLFPPDVPSTTADKSGPSATPDSTEPA
ncbi:MAG: YihY family inner membrane protein [Dokdonella sp.]